MPRDSEQPTIIRKYEDHGDHAHHGGAWKIAYADFMTAMFALFLMLWLVATKNQHQLDGIANYFKPATVSMTAKGGTGPLSGTVPGPHGVVGGANPAVTQKDTVTLKKLSAVHPLGKPVHAVSKTAASSAPSKGAGNKVSASVVAQPSKDSGQSHLHALQAVKTVTVVKTVSEHALDTKRFQAIEKQIRQAMQAEPNLRPLMKNVLFQQTPQGLRIQIVDQDKRPMFASGSARLTKAADLLMQKLGHLIATLPNKVTISGHTDAVPYSNGAHLDNWDLSSERANATRKIFTAAGVSENRIARVSGLADTEPLKPADPRAAINRRITVLLAYQAGSPKPTAPAGTVLQSTTQASAQTRKGSVQIASAANKPATPTAAQTPHDTQYPLISLAEIAQRK